MAAFAAATSSAVSTPFTITYLQASVPALASATCHASRLHGESGTATRVSQWSRLAGAAGGAPRVGQPLAGRVGTRPPALYSRWRELGMRGGLTRWCRTGTCPWRSSVGCPRRRRSLWCKTWRCQVAGRGWQGRAPHPAGRRGLHARQSTRCTAPRSPRAARGCTAGAHLAWHGGASSGERGSPGESGEAGRVRGDVCDEWPTVQAAL